MYQLTETEQNTIASAYELAKNTTNKRIALLIKNIINSVNSTLKSIDLIPNEKENLLYAVSRSIDILKIIIHTTQNNNFDEPLNSYLINPKTGFPYILEQNRSIYGEKYDEILYIIYNIENLESTQIAKKGSIRYYQIEYKGTKLYLATYKNKITIITASNDEIDIKKYHKELKKQTKKENKNNKSQTIYNLIVESEFDLNYSVVQNLVYSKKESH